MKNTLYNYQRKSVDFVISKLPKKNTLLAAAPNAGKTYMSIAVMLELLTEGKRILCSIHGTNILKRQFYNSVISEIDIQFVSIYDTNNLELFDPSKPIQIMIYQNIKQIEECVDSYGKFDHLIVDEAHKFYNAPSMVEISNEYVSGSHLLLTGSPAIFKKDVTKNKIESTYIAVSTIQEDTPDQYDSNIITDILTNDIMLGLSDFNSDGEVLNASEHKLDESDNTALLDTLLVNDFGKTIIFVKSIQQSRNIGEYLTTKNLSVLVSNSQDDTTSENIDTFKTMNGNHILIVVGRCREGFDDPNVSIIDITYSKNIDTLYQMYSRAIRMPTVESNKRYFKVVPNDILSANLYLHIMTAVMMLLKQKHFESFNGKNFSLPTIKQEVKVSDGDRKVKSYVKTPEIITSNILDSVVTKKSNDPVKIEELIIDDNFNVTLTHNGDNYDIDDNYEEWVKKLDGETYSIKVSKSKSNIDNDLLIQTSLKSGIFFDITNKKYGLIHKYATSKLSTVLNDICNGEKASAEEHIKFIKDNNVRSLKYQKIYKSSELNLVCQPWAKTNFGNGSQKDYFESILGVNRHKVSSEDYIKFIKDNNITSTRKYRELYKTSELDLVSAPWRPSTSAKDYFESIWHTSLNKPKSEDHIKFIKDNSITSNAMYRELYKTSELKLLSEPWTKTNFGNGSQKDYFGNIWEKTKLRAFENNSSEEEHIKFIKDNNLTTSGKYSKAYKSHKLKLASEPWAKTNFGNGNRKNYFDNIWDKKVKASEKQHIKFIKDNDITSNSEYTKLYKLSELNLYSCPWIKYGNGSVTKYFKRIYLEEENIIDNMKKNRKKSIIKS
jgi:superfamily II DNA or RNA helicase